MAKNCKHSGEYGSLFETRRGGYCECKKCGAVKLGRQWGDLCGKIYASLDEAKEAAAPKATGTAAKKNV